jgi:RNA polymerase sigma-70 factor (ECF subfamily)
MKHGTTTCRNVFRHLCDRLDADLHSPKCRAIKRHIDACPDCVTYLKSLKQTVELYRRYPIPRRSKASAGRLAAALRNRS